MIKKDELKAITSHDIQKVLNVNLVYKYSSYNVGLNDIFLKRKLKFSSPEEYNDPFDTHEYLMRLNSNDISELITKYALNLSRVKKREMLRKFEKGEFAKVFKEEKKNHKVTCFSSESDNVLMWSHYGDKHKGICIGFDFTAINENKFILSPVTYIDEIPEFHGEVNTYQLIRYWYSLKSISWRHENEIRAITNSKDNSSNVEYIQFERARVKEIVFGCKVSDSEIKTD